MIQNGVPQPPVPVEFHLPVRRPDGAAAGLLYRPHSSELRWVDTGGRVDLSPVGLNYETGKARKWARVPAISPDNPGRKNRAIRALKIQMGLKCNYHCTYCNQTSRPRASHGNLDDARRFLAQLPTWLVPVSDDGRGLTIEFWGGEPFIYWKTMRFLAEELHERYPKAVFNVVTNGSVLDDEKIDWLDRMQFSVAISHDGPGQKPNRGEDPFDSQGPVGFLRKLHRRLHPKGLINFNCVLARNNMSLSAIRCDLADKLGCAPGEVRLSTEELLLPYEDEGYRLSLQDEEDRHSLFMHLYRDLSGPGAVRVLNIRDKLLDFFKSIAVGRPATALGQRCGMDRRDTLAVDLQGNVLTCQNTPADEINTAGHVGDYDGIRLRAAYHWSWRSECRNCLVLQLCRGSCMRLTGNLWRKACENSYVYNLALLAVGIEHLTGCHWARPYESSNSVCRYNLK